MARPGELVKEMAAALNVPEATVMVHDRNLVIAGLRSKGGRGLSAATVKARDAAHLLVALLASAHVKDSVHSVRRYQVTRPDKAQSSDDAYQGLGITELAALPARHSFIDALEALIQSAATGSLRDLMERESVGSKKTRLQLVPLIEVAAMTPGTVGDIRISGTGTAVSRSIRYRLPDPWSPTDGKAGGKASSKRPKDSAIEAWSRRVAALRINSDLEQYRRVSQKTILRLATLIGPVEET